MATPWFCKIDDEELGPISGATLKEMVADGRVDRKTLIRRGDTQRWIEAAQVQGLFGTAKAAAKKAASSSNPKLKRAQSLDGPAAAAPPPPVAAPPPPVSPAAPAAAPPPPMSDSGAIPAGIPVGAPVTAPTQGVATQVPMGQAVAPAAGYAASSAYDEGDDPIEARRRAKQQKQLIMVIGMVAVIVIAAGGGIIYAVTSGGNTPEVAENPAEPNNDPVLPDESEPVAEVQPGANDTSDANTEQAASEPTVDLEALLAQVSDKEWREVSPLRTISLRGLYKLKVSAAWLTDDPSGATALDPKLILSKTAPPPAPADPDVNDDAEEAPAQAPANPLEDLLATQGESLPENDPAGEKASGDNAAPASASGRYVIVRVELTNAGEEQMTYESWNPVAGEEIAARLIAAGTTELKAIPISRASGPGRSGKTVLGPGEQVTDHLVFAAPKLPVSSLRLLMPKPALGRDGMYGFDITAEVMQSKFEEHLAAVAKAKKNEKPPAVAPQPDPAAVAAPANVVAQEPPKEEPKPLSEAERLRRERDAFLRSINGDPDEEMKEKE